MSDVLDRSASYSELRRKATQRSAMPRPSVALGGISALALVAGSTLPTLLGSARASHKERVAYAVDAHAKAKTEAAVRGSWGTSVATGGNSVVAAASNAASGAHGSPSGASGPSVQTPVTQSGADGDVTAVATQAPAPKSVASSPSDTAVSMPTSVTETVRLASDTTSAGQGSSLVAQVRELQQRLHLDPVDGSFGAATEQGVVQFQTEHGLTATGVVDSKTREALGLGPGPSLHPQVSAEALTAPAPSTEPVVSQERAASPGSVEEVSGGAPGRTTTPPTSTSGPTATPQPTTTPGRTTTPGPTATPQPTTTPPPRTTTPPQRTTTPTTTTPSNSTTTTGTSGPSSNVQQGLNRMIAAGNQIATRPYVYGGGHGSFNSNGYDCSGSVSYVLHAAGLLSSPEDSTELESYGMPGHGKYVSIYANSGHAWMTIEGRRFDTVALAESGSRWSNHMVSTSGFVVRHPKGY